MPRAAWHDDARCDAPEFAPLSPWWPAIVARGEWPDAAVLDGFARDAGLQHANGRAIRFVPAREPLGALAYERAIFDTGRVAIREREPHDTMNALAWLAYPATKSALNRLHVERGAAATANRRDGVRDAATLLDESGLLLACDSTVATTLRARDWRAFYHGMRASQTRIGAWAIGHGLLVKRLAPFRSITAKVLVVDVEDYVSHDRHAATDAVDRRSAELVLDPTFGPASLVPLPAAALPGWDGERMGEHVLDDLSVFRPSA